MPLIVKDRVQETTSTTGTGTLTLSGAVSGFQPLSSIGNGNTTYYCVVGGTEWEVGIGTYTLIGTILSRDTILASSNGGSAVNFSAGVKNVFVTYPAGKAVTLDDVQTLTNKTLTSPTLTTPVLGTPTSGTLTNCTFPTLNQNTTGTASNVTGTVAIANGGTGSTTNSGARTNLGATTVGSNFFTLTNPTAVTFPRMNADNTVSSLDATTFRTAIGAGTGSGTVTSVTGTAPVVSSGGATPAISMAAATTSVSGYLTSTDWNTFNGKQPAGSYVTVGGALGTPSSGTLTNCTFPTLNQNTTGSSGSCTGNAATATSADNIDGIAFKNAANGASFVVDTQGTNGIGYSSGYTLFGQTDGGVYCSTYDASWQHQINGDFRTGQIAIRGKQAGTWQAWRVVLDSSNSTSYTCGNTNSISNAVGGAYTWTGVQLFQANQNTGSGSNPPLQAYSSSGGAMMSFHRGGVYAINMGLDSDNVFRIGGWSAGANRLQMDMSGNLTMAGTIAGSNLSGTNTGDQTNISGNAATATKLSTASGSAPSYSARAWVNWNGTGTVAIRASGNVSSITDNGTGSYTVNFTTAMDDANYAVSVAAQGINTGNLVAPMGTYGTNTGGAQLVAPTTAGYRISTWASNLSGQGDVAYVMSTTFR
jgi:hypothetical protein